VKGKMCQKLSGTVFMVHTLRMAIKHGKQVWIRTKVHNVHIWCGDYVSSITKVSTM
jgi:hypothetical protein